MILDHYKKIVIHNLCHFDGLFWQFPGKRVGWELLSAVAQPPWSRIEGNLYSIETA